MTTARRNGLSGLEAQALLLAVGPNEPVPKPRQRLVVQLLRRFASPLVAILLLACVASAAAGDLQNAAIIVVMVGLSVIIDFVQTHRSERAAASLQTKVAHTATALRDGVFREVLRRDLVPGDVIRLSAGDMAVSTAYEVDGRIEQLDEVARQRARATFEQLGGKGYRVLAVAYASVERRARFSKADEHDLTLAGFLAFVDPPREDARSVLVELRREGIDVKVLTGDGDLVARHVCESVGVPVENTLVGAEIEKMSDPALAHRAERTHLFARVSPAQKTRILAALRSRGHVVGFLGDGINDAPSLHTADVGISVANAVDVARDAADIILLEPNLLVLLAGVREGRKAFGNVMKYLLMGTSSNFGNMLSMAGAVIFLPFLPMLPGQILLNNLLYDLAQLTIPTDNVDASFLQKPRRWDIDVVRRFAFIIGPVSSLFDFATFAFLIGIFHASERSFHTGWFVESLATQTLVILVIRTMGSPLRSRPSLALGLSVMAIVAIGCALPFTPLGAWLGFVPLPAAYFVFVLVATTAYMALVELVKRLVVRRAFP